MSKKHPKVLLKWTGDEPVRVRLENGGDKVEMKKGDCRFCEPKKASNISRSYKGFEVCGMDEVDEKDVKATRKCEESKPKAPKKVEKKEEPKEEESEDEEVEE